MSAEAFEAPFRIDDDDRYASLRLIPWWRQERLARARVLVVGAGALGNEAIKNLALVGVGHIGVVDLDTIEPGNLARSVLFRAADSGRSKAEIAAERARELNPEIEVVARHGDVIHDVGLGDFFDADVVIGCLDNREARLWVNRQCWKANTPWVDAGIQEIQGVVKVFVPPGSACYECAMTTRDYQLLNLRYSCPLLKREDLAAGKVPTAPTIASMMAALEVQEALKILHGMPVDAGCALVFNGAANNFYRTQLPVREGCLSHETYPKPRSLSLSHGATLADLFAAARASLGGPLSLVLCRDLVTRLECPRCDWTSEVFKPRHRVSAGDAVCSKCDQPARFETIDRVDEGGALASRSLAELGIPPYDVVRIDGSDASGFFLLGGDTGFWKKAGA